MGLRMLIQELRKVSPFSPDIPPNEDPQQNYREEEDIRMNRIYIAGKSYLLPQGSRGQLNPVDNTNIQDMVEPNEAASSTAPALAADEESDSCLAKAFSFVFSHMLHRESLEVAILTIAHGGDNIAIYLPLFATADAVTISATLVTFYGMLTIWLVTTYSCVGGKKIAHVLSTNGRLVVPFLIIGVGLYILSNSILFHPHGG